MISALSTTRSLVIQSCHRRIGGQSLLLSSASTACRLFGNQQLNDNQQHPQKRQSLQQQQQQQQKSFFHSTTSTCTTQQATTTSTTGYVFVDHSAAYIKALDGPHGKQLELAVFEGEGKDDPDFDPFIEEEMEEDRLAALAAASVGGKVDTTTTKKSDDDAKNDDNDEDDEDDEEEDDDEIEDDDNDWRVLYNNDGSLKRSKAELTKLVAGAPAGGIFAIVELAGSQYKVTTDDVLIVNRLQPVSKYKIGSTHTLTGSQVLLLGTSHYTIVGMPSIVTAEVDVMVEEITQDTKIIVFSKRRRKNSKRRNGFRRDVTMLRIIDIRPPATYSSTYYTPRPEPTPPSSNVLTASSSATI